MPPVNHKLAHAGLVLAFSLLTSVACGESPAVSAPAAPPPMEVGVSVVELREIRPTQDLSGRIEATQHVEVRPRVSGYVTAVSYREGAEVAAGAPLFTIDDRPYRAALARARAEQVRAEARRDLTRREGQRAEELFAAKVISSAERDTTTSGAAQAEAELVAAQAAVELAALDVEFTRVRAPIAGRTGRAQVTVGAYVAAGPGPSVLTTIASVDPVHVYFTGDEQTYLRLAARSGPLPVALELSSETGFPHAGTVDFIDNRMDPSTGTIRVRAVVPNPSKRLMPGLYARVRLPDAVMTRAVLVDDKAILTDQDRKYVYVLDAADTVARRDVDLGALVDGLRVVSAGLNEGDRVVVRGIQKVFPGGKARAAPARIESAALAPVSTAKQAAR